MADLETINPKCPNCGARTSITLAPRMVSHGIRCQYCGTRVRLKRAPGVQHRGGETQPPPEWQVYHAPSGVPKIAWIIVGLVAFGVVSAAAMVVVVNRPGKAPGKAPSKAPVATHTTPTAVVPEPAASASATPVAATAAQRGEVTIGELKVRGPLRRAIVSRIIKRHQRSIEFCYKQALVKDPALEGLMVMQAAVSKTGAVKTIETVESTANAPLLEQCFRRRLSSLHFPASKSGMVLITVPIRFQKE